VRLSLSQSGGAMIGSGAAMRVLRLRRVPLQLVVATFVAVATLAFGPACDGGEPAKTTGKAATGKAGEPSAVADADLIREAEGVELGRLSESQRETFFQVLNRESSACAKPHSLATSLRDDPECRDSKLVAQMIADRIAAGATAADVKLMIDEVVQALTPAEIDLDGRPVYGNPKAPVTVVVFADFQCPRCKSEAPVLRKEIDDRRGQAKLVFKHFPLPMHDRGEPAAIAVEAAHVQGKFWEMHDLVFANQTQLDDADLERYAKQIDGLDLGQWKTDLATASTKSAVVSDRADGKVLNLPGTPAVFVDGRQVTPLLWDGELSSWIDDALRR
jgi:protein-disulfide isomerase